MRLAKHATNSVSLILTVALVIVTCMCAARVVGAQESTPSPELEQEPNQPVLFAVRPALDSRDAYFDDVEIAQGQTLDLEFVVLNWGEIPVDVRIYKTNAANPENGGFLAGREADEPTSLTSWLAFQTLELSLQPNTHETLTLSVSVPANADPGQYISSIVAETVDPLPIPGTTLVDQQVRFAMAVSILVPGDLHYSFELGEPVLDGQLIRVPISNTGNYLVKPHGEIEIVDPGDAVILSGPIEMEPVYAGGSTFLVVKIPAELPEGEYTVNLKLVDASSGAEAVIESAPISVMDVEEEADYVLTSYNIVPNGAEIVYAGVSVVVDNRSQQVSSTSVMLVVYRDGELFEEFPLASNQILVRGENEYTARYIPEGMWVPGTYTFRVVVKAVDPNDGPQLLLLDSDLDVQLVVP